jgi:hypothetical protein
MSPGFVRCRFEAQWRAANESVNPTRNFSWLGNLQSQGGASFDAERACPVIAGDAAHRSRQGGRMAGADDRLRRRPCRFVDGAVCIERQCAMVRRPKASSGCRRLAVGGSGTRDRAPGARSDRSDRAISWPLKHLNLEFHVRSGRQQAHSRIAATPVRRCAPVARTFDDLSPRCSGVVGSNLPEGAVF